MSNTKRFSAGSHVFGVLLIIGCALVAGLLLLNRQCVVDHLSAWQFHPSGEVVALADRTTMSGDGRFFFYASQPSVDTAQKFNQECSRKETSTAILGCYNGRNIFIYNVTDSRVDGIKEVTAAHEMLHAAYDRMSASEKKTVDGLLEAEYNKLKDDKDFSQRMAFYARTEPGERDNELHSVIGTEVANISPQLEAHYKKYFTDRSKVIALHDKYASVFDDLQTKNEALVKQLRELGDQILAEQAQYKTQRAQLEADIADFKSRESSGGFSSRDSYEGELASLNSRIDEFNQFRDQIENDIKTYNSLQQEQAGIVSQSQELDRSIDSSLAPAPSL